MRIHTKGIPVLMYHSISDADSFFAVTPETFERHLQILQNRNFKSIFVSELNATMEVGEHAVCITIDDGYKDVVTTVMPLLRKYNMKATVFLITDLIGGEYVSSTTGARFPLMSEDDVRSLNDSRYFEFMPHTRTHPNLDMIPHENALDEIEGSRKAVESLTGKRAAFLSYPRGRATPALRDYVREGDWDGAFSVERGIATSQSDPFFVPRIAVDAATSERALKAALSGWITIYRLLKIVRSRLGFSL